LVAVILLPLFLAGAEPGQKLLEKKSTHFIVYYSPGIDASAVDDIIRKGEQYYQSITDKIGFTRFDFWTWEKRCKIYLYATLDDYHKATGQAEWAQASVEAGPRVMYAAMAEKDLFLNTVLPHEMTHLIFREFAGYGIPLWLSEGMACFMEQAADKPRIFSAKLLAKTPMFIDFATLVSGQDAIIQQMPDIFYDESASLVEFLLRDYGKEKFSDFCLSLRDQTGLSQAIEKVYGFKSLRDMDAKWREFLSR